MQTVEQARSTVGVRPTVEDEPYRSAQDAAAAVSEAIAGHRVIDLRTAGREEGELHELLGRLVATVEAFEGRARRAEEDSLIDPLTQLGNRRAWRLAISEADERIRRGGSPAVVAVIDLDDLKSVNDTRGHVAGDVLLRHLANTLVGSMRAADIVARLGGDEFGVLAVETEGAERVAERIEAALKVSEILASVGVAALPEGGSLHHAWEAADFAMYAEKARRRAARR